MQSEEQLTASWRDFHAKQLERQTKAIESIRGYVAVWFWISIIAVLGLVLSVNA